MRGSSKLRLLERSALIRYSERSSPTERRGAYLLSPTELHRHLFRRTPNSSQRCTIRRIMLSWSASWEYLEHIRHAVKKGAAEAIWPCGILYWVPASIATSLLCHTRCASIAVSIGAGKWLTYLRKRSKNRRRKSSNRSKPWPPDISHVQSQCSPSMSGILKIGIRRSLGKSLRIMSKSLPPAWTM